MKCFQIDLNELPKVALWGKEALIPPRLHYSRYLTEYVMYVVIKGELKLMVNEDVVVLGTGDVYIFCNGDLQESLESSFCEYYYVHFCSESLCETELDEAEGETTEQHFSPLGLSIPINFGMLFCIETVLLQRVF